MYIKLTRFFGNKYYFDPFLNKLIQHRKAYIGSIFELNFKWILWRDNILLGVTIVYIRNWGNDFFSTTP